MRQREPISLWRGATLGAFATCALAASILCSCGGLRGIDDPFLPAELPANDGVEMLTPTEQPSWSSWAGSATRAATRRARGIDDPRVAWSSRVGILGYANSPLVDGETIYVASQGATHNAPDDEDGAYALDARTGAQLWFTPTEEDLNGATLGERALFAGTDSGTLYAFDRATGATLWSQSFGHAHHHGPVLLDGRLWVNGRDIVYELDAGTGDVLRRVPVPRDDWSVRGALSVHEGGLLRTSRNGGLQRIEDGAMVWERGLVEMDRDGYAHAPQYAPAVIVGDVALVSAPVNLAYGSVDIDVVAVDAISGAIRWRAALAEVGPELTRRGPMNSYDLGYSATAPWVSGGLVFVPWLEGAYLLGLELADGSGALSVPLPDCRSRQFATLVGVPSRGYYARHDGALYSFVPSTGELDWAMQLGALAGAGQVTRPLAAPASFCTAEPYHGVGLYAPPALSEDGWIYVGAGSGVLYAIVDEQW